MALETLANVKQVGGFPVTRSTAGPSRDVPICILDATNELTFKIQDRPVGETGVNGCQIDTVIETAKIMLDGLNTKHPCRENGEAITKLDEALMWLKKRRDDRTVRGVEGTNQP